MKILKLLTLLQPLIILNLGLTQTPKKIIEFNDQKIEEVKASSNYVVVKTYRETRPHNTVYVYDKNGNELFQKTRLTGYILQADVVEPFDYVIIVHMGWEGTPGYQSADDTIKAFDIHTGRLIWQTTANAAGYEISPDGKHMITRTPADRRSPFTIINLENGTKYEPELKGIGQYQAAWIDNQNIVIAERLSKRKQPSERERYLNEKLRNLHHELGRLTIQFRRGMLDKKGYEQQGDSIKSLIKEIQEKLIKFRKERGSQRWIKIGTRVVIYDFVLDQINVDRVIGKVNGKIFLVPAVLQSVPWVNVDQNGFIYIFGSLFQDDKFSEDCVLKLDNDLNTLWLTTLVWEYYNIIKITYDGKLCFGIRDVSTNEIYFIDLETGYLKTFEQFKPVLDIFPFSEHIIPDIKLKKYDFIYRLFDNLYFDYKDNKILFF